MISEIQYLENLLVKIIRDPFRLLYKIVQLTYLLIFRNFKTRKGLDHLLFSTMMIFCWIRLVIQWQGKHIPILLLFSPYYIFNLCEVLMIVMRLSLWKLLFLNILVKCKLYLNLEIRVNRLYKTEVERQIPQII